MRLSLRSAFVFALSAVVSVLASPLLADEAAPELLRDADLAHRSLDLQQQRFFYDFIDSPTVERSRLVRLADVRIAELSQARLSLFPGEEVKVERSWVEERGQEDYTWVGTIPGHATQVILVVHGDNVTGSVVDGDRHYALRPLGGGLTVVAQLDPKAFPQDHPEGAYEILEAEAGPVTASLMERPLQTPASGQQALVERACSYVDVIVAYTNTAASQVSDIYGLTQLAVAETNQSHINSGVYHQIRLVHFYNTNYNDSSNMTTNRDRFRINGDGYMDEIHGKRNTYGGDVAVLMQGSSGSSCGIAAAIYASSSTAFAVVAHPCATGYYSFGHEIGHLHGARHNTQADPTNTPYAYGHGYYYTPADWRTVMSYDCPGGCTRLPYWSNPSVTYGGVPMGTTSTNDNERVLDNTSCRLAGFK